MTATWPDLPADHPYGTEHLPYGVFSTGAAPDRRSLGIRIGDHVLDLGAAATAAGTEWADTVSGGSLDPLLAAGRATWSAVRAWARQALTDPASRGAVEPHLHPVDGITLHLPFRVADYVDFYASEHHATNVGRIFRPDGDALTPNWKHLPIGYHGRSSTVVVSGTDIVRPTGQRKGPNDPAPVFGPSVKLDIEAEVGFVVGGATEVGSRVGVDEAADHLFGVALFNDWSARDIQAWEYVPLGPFLGKSFASSIAAWITPLEALSAARVPLPGQDPTPLDYLRGSEGSAFGLDLDLEVRLNGTLVSRPPYRTMYWSPAQMLAHLTVNGAALSDGDLFASGTVSGTDPASRGSLLELTWNGTEPITLEDGSTRSFLEDGDTVTISASAPGPDGSRIGLGEVSGTIRPAV
ncbi:fumarylacetoacetase [Ornithinicoccus hortensis]|uniref:fumarylacetoacetase n=1 Tax=Ornithinicoccus hortensis TaxID=82346 RepID=A0A542YRH4_9MICO|nr:fumarylacetoacetase [Ornithinicoccus hortensis]TQL50703.1 fumarylacetoacetate hydrolase [Ornithinicoccus hortensis]